MFVEKSSNIVIVGTNFAPLTYNHHWLITNGIFTNDQIEKGSFFTQDFTQIVTRDFFISIFINQLTFTLKVSDYSDEIIETYDKFISKMVDVNFTAMGVNFIKSINNEDSGAENLSRKYFFFKESKLHNMFDKQDARFGVYLSMDYEGCRLRLDIKPKNIILSGSNINTTKVLGFTFNYHLDLTGDKMDAVRGHIKKWKKLEEYSDEIVNLY